MAKIQREPFVSSLSWGGRETILIAELADGDSWKLLIDRSGAMGDQNLLAQFQRAMAEEEAHVVEVRNLLKELTMGKTRL